MRVRVLAFGSLRHCLPNGELWRELTHKASVGELIDLLRQEGVFSEAALASAAVAVNHEYAQRSTLLANGDEVAILPPVSGGAPNVALVTERIDGAALLESVKVGADGAVVVFDGIVRNNTRGRETLHLDYEAYEDMALKQMVQLREQAIVRFGVRDVVIVHRLGRLCVGETSVFIAVASAHRGVAFEACRWLIDTLKQAVPVWKREQFVDGAVWVDGEPFPEEIARVLG